MTSLSDLLRRLPALARGQDEVVPPPSLAVVDAASRAATGSSVRRILMLAQAEALDAFRKAGLPDTPGVFGFDPEQAAWAPLGVAPTPTERWAHVLNHPRETGWRYAGLSQIGRRERPGDPIIALAADLLDQITTSLARLDGEAGVDAAGRHDLEVAFELTMTWMRLVEATSSPAAPAKAARAPRKKAEAKSRKAASS